MTKTAVYVGNVPWHIPAEEAGKLLRDMLTNHSIAFNSSEIVEFESSRKRSARDHNKLHKGFATVHLAGDADIDAVCRVCPFSTLTFR